MDLRQLRYFLAVVEHGSFTRAAAASGRTQQALSKGIQALEQQLGERLFERGTREARLTPAGRLLLDHARTADDAVRRFEGRLQELQTLEKELVALRDCCDGHSGVCRTIEALHRRADTQDLAAAVGSAVKRHV